ncbi:hypothetical protein OAP83_02190 [Rickettsiales bacterium]|nr:hypothetical protein [Rickettsiales bacterium]
MKKILSTILICILVSNCSYGYLKHGSYNDVKPKYRSEQKQNLALHYKTSSRCTGGTTVSYCSNRPMLRKTDNVFSEYNISPIVAKKYENKPTLEVYDVSNGSFINLTTQMLSIITLGIIPAREKRKFEATFTDGQYKVSNTEYETRWNSWLIIPFSNESDIKFDNSLILDGVLRSTINQVIDDNKMGINVEDVSNEPEKLFKNKN